MTRNVLKEECTPWSYSQKVYTKSSYCQKEYTKLLSERVYTKVFSDSYTEASFSERMYTKASFSERMYTRSRSQKCTARSHSQKECNQGLILRKNVRNGLGQNVQKGLILRKNVHKVTFSESVQQGHSQKECN